MFNRYVKVIIAVLIVASIVVVGMHRKSSAPDELSRELLIYCGNTMIEPLSQIAEQFEKEHACIVKIIKGGSGELYDCLKVNRLGDLFLPGSEDYIEKARQEGLVAETQVVGCNQAVLMVRKGNPKNIQAELNSILDPGLRTVLGDPEMGSVGRESRAILEAAGIYAGAFRKALFLTPDTKGLSQVLSDDVADLTISWRATAFRLEAQSMLEILPTSLPISKPHKLKLVLLNCAGEVALARLFFAAVTSVDGRALFAAHGFSCGGRL